MTDLTKSILIFFVVDFPDSSSMWRSSTQDPEDKHFIMDIATEHLFIHAWRSCSFTLLAEHIMGCKFPNSPCRKMAYTRGFLFLCHVIQKSQVSACSFTWFSTLLPRRRDQGRYLSCIVFIKFSTNFLPSSLGWIFDWDKPLEEADLKTNSCKWSLGSP